jgi:hypothetical protein
MRKICLILVTLFLTCIGTFGQEAEGYIGVGRMLISESGSAYAYSTSFETNYVLGGRYFLNEKIAIGGNFTRDTASIGEWAYLHNFSTKLPVHKYDYILATGQIEYWFMKDVYGFVGPVYCASPVKGVDSKWGVSGGLGLRHDLYKKTFWQTEAKFIHVQNFIVPVANTLNWTFCVGYRF